MVKNAQLRKTTNRGVRKHARTAKQSLTGKWVKRDAKSGRFLDFADVRIVDAAVEPKSGMHMAIRKAVRGFYGVRKEK